MSRLPPETIRTRWADGLLGFGLGAAMGGGAALLAIQTLAPLPDSIFLHAKIWSFGLAHKCGLNIGNWQDYSNYIKQLAAAGHPYSIPARMTLTATSAIAGACTLAWRFGKPRNSLVYHSGARVLRGKAALKAAEPGQGIEITPGVRLTHKRERSHVLIAGGTGSGKSVVGWNFMLSANRRNDRILLIDFKGFTENWPSRNGDTIILSPTDKRSKVWAISKDVKTKQNARQLAEMLILESKEPIWSNTSRQVLTGCMLKLISEKGVGNWGWRDLANLVSLPQDELKQIMEEHFPEGLRAVAEPGKTTDSVLLTLSGYMGIVYDLADAWENRLDGISIKSWFRNPDSKIRTIILQISTEFSLLSSAFNSAIINQFESCLSSMPDVPAHANPLWIIADEAPQLGKGLVKGWNNFLVVGRSKGIRVVMSVQSKSQLDEMAGDNLSSTWIDSIGTKVIGQLDGDGAKWASEILGETVYLRPTYTTAHNGKEAVSWSQQAEPAFKPTQVIGELGELENGLGVRMVVHGFKSRPNIKILNTLTKYIPHFETYKQPVELVLDFPFPKLGKKDGSPLRPQTVLADFCINPKELKSNQKITEITPLSLAQQPEKEVIEISEIVETAEISEVNLLDMFPDVADNNADNENEFHTNLSEEALQNVSSALISTSVGAAIGAALNVADTFQAIKSDVVDPLPTLTTQHKKRKLVRKSQVIESEQES